MQVNCSKRGRLIAVSDVVESPKGRLSHLDCTRRNVLTGEERQLLFVYCSDHVVAECVPCGLDFRLTELPTDLLDGRTNMCPRCRKDLTENLRGHLYSCAMLPSEVRLRAQALREAAQRLVKQSQELVANSDLLIREAEAKLFESPQSLRADGKVRVRVGSSAIRPVDETLARRRRLIEHVQRLTADCSAECAMHEATARRATAILGKSSALALLHRAHMAATRLERIIRQKLDDGRLPHTRTSEIFSSRGAGRCAVCEDTLRSDQRMIEVPPTTDGHALYLHVSCFLLWDDIRLESGSGIFRLTELAADPLGTGRVNLCPRCRQDLTEDVRAHLYGCAMLPSEVRQRAQAVREAAHRLVKQSQELVANSDVLIREAEAALFKTQQWLREAMAKGTQS